MDRRESLLLIPEGNYVSEMQLIPYGVCGKFPCKALERMFEKVSMGSSLSGIPPEPGY